MGLKTAHRLLRKYQTVPKLLQAVRMEGMRVPETYHEDL
jgi:exonuclease-1